MWWRWSRVTEPRAWSLGGEELALVRYVDPAEVARHVQLPGPSAEGRLARLREVYTRLAAGRHRLLRTRPPARRWARS